MSGRWHYAFSCRNCLNKIRIDTDTYCVPLRALRDPIHADDDYVVRCDEYQPAQISLFEEGGGDSEVDQNRQEDRP